MYELIGIELFTIKTDIPLYDITEVPLFELVEIE